MLLVKMNLNDPRGSLTRVDARPGGVMVSCDLVGGAEVR